MQQIKLSAKGASKCYTTLSYAWGETFPDGSHLTNVVCCDGKSLRVTANLHQALKRIRESWSKIRQLRQDYSRAEYNHFDNSTSPHLWIDAISINQDDMEERSRQVAIMGDIYKHSSTLLVWLGEFYNADVDEFRLLFQPPVSQYLHNWNKDDHLWMLTEHRARYTEKLLQLPWFQRRWVIQEYFHSPATCKFMMVNDMTIPDTSFESFIREAKLTQSPGPLKQMRWDAEYGLIEALHVYSSAKCSHAHDRVYALLSRSSTKQAKFEVDYSISEATLYVKVALHGLNLDTLPKRSNRHVHVLAAVTCYWDKLRDTRAVFKNAMVIQTGVRSAPSSVQSMRKLSKAR